MRVVEDARARPPESRGAAPSRRFGDALRRAGTRGAPPAAGGAGAGASVALAAAARRAAAARDAAALSGRREAFREEARLAAPPPAPVPPRASEGPHAPELRALVRTLPLAIQTFGVRDGAPLALSFGRSLDVELRAAPQGVELALRPEPRLARAARAELGGVVAALARRGITVARAVVRVRTAQADGTPAPCVDLAPGVR